MAVLIVVSVLDRALDAYARPVFVHTEGLAIRSFQDEINRKAEDNPLAKHPEDYDLYVLATFDEETGRFQSFDEPKQIAIGKQLVLKGG